jgi:hypothetical protein
VAKRRAWSVPGDVVRQLRGTLHVDEYGVVISTSRFTRHTIDEAGAADKAPIGLVDCPKLADFLIAQGIGVQKRALSTWTIDLGALQPRAQAPPSRRCRPTGAGRPPQGSDSGPVPLRAARLESGRAPGRGPC